MLSLIALLALAGALPKKSAPPDEPLGPPIAANEVEIRAIRAALDDQLADAESARLKDIVVRHGTDRGGHACGKVNGKNRFGAYVGYQTLYADLFDWKDHGVKAIVWSTDPDLAAIMCKKHGM